jgi:hypothetical protein
MPAPPNPIPPGTFDAQIIYFDGIQSLGHHGNIINVTVTVGVVVPSKNGRTVTIPKIAAHLRFTAAIAQQLRDTLATQCYKAADAAQVSS